MPADVHASPSMSLATPLKRTAIFVENIEASSSFYEALFGYELWLEGDMTGEEDEAVFKLVGLPAQGPCRFKVVRANRTDYGMIGFFEYREAGLPRLRKEVGRVSIGETCLVFVTPHFDQVFDRLLSLQAVIVAEPMVLTYKSRPIQREMTFYDRDGVMVNLIEQDLVIPTS